MKYRKWDPKTKAKIVLEGLQNNQPLSELCNNYQISQNQYYNWLKELLAFSKHRWIREFERENFESIKILKGPVSSGYRFRMNKIRNIFEKVGLTGEYVYIFRKTYAHN